MRRDRESSTDGGIRGWKVIGAISVLFVLFVFLIPVIGLGLGSLMSGDQDRLLKSRTADCIQCEELAGTVSGEDFLKDPHEFECQVCHHPHEEEASRSLHQTCASAGCHPRAWTESVYHRLDPEVFLDCTNCHQPHTWSLEDADCVDCHQPVLGLEGTVLAGLKDGAKEFPHHRHQDLKCEACHATEAKHGLTRLSTQKECVSCHHGSESKAECRTCHEPGELAGTKDLTFSVQFDIWNGPRSRELPFDHQNHGDIPCDRCHQGEDRMISSRCADCHEDHHQSKSRCISCHQETSESVHTLAVHDSGCAGSGCHLQESFQAFAWTRNLCLSCHVSETDHEPAQDCVQCHKVSP